jgi:hypothetical protein
MRKRQKLWTFVTEGMAKRLLETETGYRAMGCTSAVDALRHVDGPFLVCTVAENPKRFAWDRNAKHSTKLDVGARIDVGPELETVVSYVFSRLAEYPLDAAVLVPSLYGPQKAPTEYPLEHYLELVKRMITSSKGTCYNARRAVDILDLVFDSLHSRPVAAIKKRLSNRRVERILTRRFTG